MTASPAHFDLFGHPAAVACERAVTELRAGRPVVLTPRPGAGLAVLALDSATPATLAQFQQLAGDGVRLLLTGERLTALGHPCEGPVSLPAAGMSVHDLTALAWQRQPGMTLDHCQPGGEQEQAAITLSRQALLLPALLVADTTAEASRWQAAFHLALDALSQGETAAESTYAIVARTPVPLRDSGWSEFVVFRGGLAQRDQVAIIVGQPDLTAPVPVRVHSSCLTGDLFGSLKCDCGDQLRHGLQALQAAGGGVLLYLDQEGRGTGIAAKMRAYGYQHEGMDTIDADALLGFGADGRRYGAAAAMLKALGMDRIVLLSNNPTKAQRLTAAGITVTGRLPVTGEVTDQNEQYLRTKAARAGHLLDVDALIAAAQR